MLHDWNTVVEQHCLKQLPPPAAVTVTAAGGGECHRVTR